MAPDFASNKPDLTSGCQWPALARHGHGRPDGQGDTGLPVRTQVPAARGAASRLRWHPRGRGPCRTQTHLQRRELSCHLPAGSLSLGSAEHAGSWSMAPVLNWGHWDGSIGSTGNQDQLGLRRTLTSAPGPWLGFVPQHPNFRVNIRHLGASLVRRCQLTTPPALARLSSRACEWHPLALAVTGPGGPGPDPGACDTPRPQGDRRPE
jgi:hypothetical protein